jgi:hypothetical protein
MKKLISLFVLFVATAAVAGDSPYIPHDGERARWTLSDMRNWKIALEAYKTDYNTYPETENVFDALQPVYINNLPKNDAWGRPYRYEKTAEGFRVVSAGTDGKFDRDSWSVGGKQTSGDADAVVTHEGKYFFRWW